MVTGSSTSCRCDAPNHYVLRRQTSTPPDLLVSSPTAWASTIRIEYASLLTAGSHYRRTNECSNGEQYSCDTRPQWVVIRQQFDDGVSVVLPAATHRYTDARFNPPSRRVLGFAVHRGP